VTIDRRNPPELHATPGYHHVTVVQARRLVFLAGQCPLSADGTVVGIHLALPAGIAVQVEQIVANTLVALAAAGATPGDVVRTVIYVASDDRAVLAEVWRQFNASPLAPAFSTASTLLGVAQLGFPGQRVELDVTAAI
jgi:enamine deaminase RidA (YjgF/YER057c/UK114 family)